MRTKNSYTLLYYFRTQSWWVSGENLQNQLHETSSRYLFLGVTLNYSLSKTKAILVIFFRHKFAVQSICNEMNFRHFSRSIVKNSEMLYERWNNAPVIWNSRTTPLGYTRGYHFWCQWKAVKTPPCGEKNLEWIRPPSKNQCQSMLPTPLETCEFWISPHSHFQILHSFPELTYLPFHCLR